jgi:hypothetical protein
LLPDFEKFETVFLMENSEIPNANDFHAKPRYELKSLLKLGGRVQSATA